MSAPLRGLIRSTNVVSQTFTQKATMVYGPPRVKISFTEKMVSAAILSTAILAGPLWVICNVKNYRANK